VFGVSTPGSWTNLVPAIRQARTYQRSWLGNDLVAGLVLVGMLAPAGMAYATAAGLPPVTGLYASIVPLVVYAIFGPSRVLILGPDSSLTPLLLAAIVPLAAAGSGEAVAIAGALSIMAGAVCIAAGLARFGFIAELLSAPVRYGYLHGIALTIIIAQAAKLSGFSVSSESLITQFRQLVDGLSTGRANGWALAVGVSSVVLIVVLRAMSKVVPAALVVVLFGIVIALVLGLPDRGVPLVGQLPSGVPSPMIPDIDWGTARTLVGAALGVAFVAFADTSVVSRTMALRRGDDVDANHELVALGMANVASGLFQGFAVSASSSRTPVAEAAGSRTQLTGMIAALALLVVTVAAPGAFRNLPDASLAAIVIAAAISLIDLPAMRRLYRVRRSEFALAVVAFLAVAVLGPVDGVIVAVVLSVLNFMRLVWKPHTAELVRVDGLKGYHDRVRHPEGNVVPGLMLYRFDAPLFFANARFFATDIERRVAAQDVPVRCVIVTAEPITDIDTTAAETLREMVDDLRTKGVELRFSELKGSVRERLDRYDLFGGNEPDHSARTTGEAVKRFVRDYPSDWVDWEDR